jgi:hypothetical protein
MATIKDASEAKKDPSSCEIDHFLSNSSSSSRELTVLKSMAIQTRGVN